MVFAVPANAATRSVNEGSTFALMHKPPGSVRVRVRSVGFWDLRVAVANYQVGRVFIARMQRTAIALRRLRPQQRAGGRRQSRVEAGGHATSVGRRRVAAIVQQGGARSSETAEDFIAARIAKDAAFLALRSGARPRERAWKAQTDATSRVQGYEPNYEGSPVVAGPPHGKCSAHGTHMFKARAGHHLAPQPLSTGRNVFEALGTGFTLLALNANEDANEDADDGTVRASNRPPGRSACPSKSFATPAGES
jgi:hypothetical protein